MFSGNDRNADKPALMIRESQSRDLPEILTLLQQLDEHTHNDAQLEITHLEKVFREMDDAPGFYLNLVCELEGRVAGFLSMIFYKTPFHMGGTALINELVVDQEVRRRGIGHGRKHIRRPGVLGDAFQRSAGLLDGKPLVLQGTRR